MGKFINLKGKKFNHLTVLKQHPIRLNKKIKWSCRCECGNKIIVLGANLKNNHTKSCGCVYSWRGKLNPKYKHGFKGTRFYNIWKSINTRCYNKNRIQYKDWGGKGIVNEWNNFIDFKKDMYESYLYHCRKYSEKETTIDRIKNNKNYCKENCKWSTMKEQERNKTSVRKIKYENKFYTLPELAKKFNIKYHTLYGRLFEHQIPLKQALINKI
jgi:hypothetical protein